MNRDEKVNSIRPLLSLADANKKPIELFQNETLRPILKFQHELTLSLLDNHKNYKANAVSKVPKNQYEEYLTKFMQTNLDLRNQILGIIIGLFTKKEIEFYQGHKKEINKRILQMQLKRYVDTLYK